MHIFLNVSLAVVNCLRQARIKVYIFGQIPKLSEEQSMPHGQNMEVKKLLLSVIGRNSVQVGPISIQVGLISIQVGLISIHFF